MVKNLDVVVVGLGMTIGLAIVLMNFTGMWPCNISQSLNKSQLADYVRSSSLLNGLSDYVRSSSLLNGLSDYVRSSSLLDKIIVDVYYWSTDLFRCS